MPGLKVFIFSQPALSVPIHVVELTNVPPELRTGNIAPTKDGSKEKTKRNEEVHFSFFFIAIQKHVTGTPCMAFRFKTQ